MNEAAIAFAESVVKDLEATIKRRAAQTARYHAPRDYLVGWERKMYNRANALLKTLRSQ